jgi:Protein of unknown function (DUF3562)
MPDERNMQVIEHDITAMAKQFAVAPSEVHDILCTEMHHLESAARIKNFVPLLAVKHVKDALRKRRINGS